MKSREECQTVHEGRDVVHWKASIAFIYFLPDFLMPCWPVLRGPFLPLAASCISFLAWASEEDQYTQGWCTGIKTQTSFQFLFEGELIFIHFLLFLLGCLQRLDLATCETFMLTGEKSSTRNNQFCTFSACATHFVYAISEGTDSRGWWNWKWSVWIALTRKKKIRGACIQKSSWPPQSRIWSIHRLLNLE